MTGRPIEIMTGRDAMDIMADSAFVRAWRKLHEQCPWATVFQGPDFLTIWYRTYVSVMTPLLVMEQSENDLHGLITLAVPVDGTGGPLVAGLLQAEYQSWLADDPAFLGRALDACRAAYPGHALTFKYVPPNAPLEHLTRSSTLAALTTVTTHQRPLMAIDPEAVAASLKKKSNKSRFNRLRRVGEVRLERPAGELDFAAALDEIIWQYDLRQGAINHSTPFLEDPFKRQFHIELARQSDILHTTVLRAGDAVVAAQINYRDGNHLCLGIPSHSPFHAEHSPGKLHMMLLAQELAQEGVTLFDLTPGDDEWKERFATSHDTVYEITVHASRIARTRQRFVMRARSTAKSTVARLGIEPARLRRDVERVVAAGTTLFRGGGKPDTSKSTGPEWYRRRANGGSPDPSADHVRRNRPADLLILGPGDVLHDRHLLLSEALRRLEAGQALYTYVQGGRLLAHAWFVTEPQQGRDAPDGSGECVMLHDFTIRSDTVDHDLVQRKMLTQMLHDATSIAGKDALVSVSAAGPSRRLLESLGFTPLFAQGVPTQSAQR